MSLFGNILKGLNSSSSYRQRNVYNPPKQYTPEEFRVYEQEQSGERWHGVPISELSRLAQETYRGRYVTVDESGFLVFHYTSRSGKTRQSVQCSLDENGRLRAMPHGYYSGQWKDSSDDFIQLANQRFSFR